MFEDGGRAEGECVDGLMQGTWLRTRPDGTRLERQYVNSVLVGEKVRASTLAVRLGTGVRVSRLTVTHCPLHA